MWSQSHTSPLPAPKELQDCPAKPVLCKHSLSSLPSSLEEKEIRTLELALGKLLPERRGCVRGVAGTCCNEECVLSDLCSSPRAKAAHLFCNSKFGNSGPTLDSYTDTKSWAKSNQVGLPCEEAVGAPESLFNPTQRGPAPRVPHSLALGWGGA